MDTSSSNTGSRAANSNTSYATNIAEATRQNMQLVDAPVGNALGSKASIPRRFLQRLSSSSSLSSITSRARSSSTAFSQSSAGPSSTSLSASSSASAAISATPLSAASSNTPASKKPAAIVATSLASPRTRHGIPFWDRLPREVKIHVLSYLSYTNLIQASRTNCEFRQLCFDGQLWATFNMDECYNKISVVTLERIIASAGKFINNVNLRGCAQVKNMKPAMLRNSQCTNITSAVLEDSNMGTDNINGLLMNNTKMVHLDVSGLDSFMSEQCTAVASAYSQLKVLNLSWCKNISATNVIPILKGCTKLRDLRISKVKGFGNRQLAHEFYKHTENLERLVLSCNDDINGQALAIMMHGDNTPHGAYSSARPTRPRKLRYLDTSHCTGLDDLAIEAVGNCAPDLEALFLTGAHAVTESGLAFVLESAKNLAVLNVEELETLSDTFMADMVATAPCAKTLEHLSVSLCREITDVGVLAVLKACPSLSYIQLDGTAITDSTMSAACSAVRTRQSPSQIPYVGLTMDVFDSAVTWRGVQKVLVQNSQVASRDKLAGTEPSMQVISLKCLHVLQQVVDEHTKRVMQGNFGSATRLEQKWSTYIQGMEDSGLDLIRYRRRMRRLRIVTEQIAFDWAEEDAQDTRAEEEEAEEARRSRSFTAACAIM